MKMVRRSVIAILLLVASKAFAQVAQVTMRFDHAQVSPNHYTLNIREDGTADYESYDDDESDRDHYRRTFVVSAETRDAAFAIAKKAGYFKGDFAYKKKNIAFTGKKTLAYERNGLKHETSFVWSENEDIREVADLFQAISITLEAEQRLRHMRRFDKLGLNAELASLEQRAERGWLREIHLIAPLLKEISSDASVVSPARARASRLLAKAEMGPQPVTVPSVGKPDKAGN